MTSQSILSQTQPGYFQGTPSGCIIPNKRYSSLSQEANITSEILFDFYLLKISVCHLRKAPIKNPLGKDLAKAWAASSLKARSPVIRSSLSFCVLDMATLLSTGASQSRKHNTSARADPKRMKGERDESLHYAMPLFFRPLLISYLYRTNYAIKSNWPRQLSDPAHLSDLG